MIASQEPPPVVGVHLDLKYHMPNRAYLSDWVRELPALGINTLLLEYEDKFPFAARPFLRDGEAFTPAELRAFLAAARQAGLRVVPLVQSLSHLEFALAHEPLAGFREAPDIPTQICPSSDEAVAFVLALIGEVLAYHEADELVHCGGDEAWFLGACPRCAEWKARAGAIGMWAGHQAKIARFVLAAGKRPIFWDDALWRQPEAVATCGLPEGVILMSWDYGATDPVADGKKLRRTRAYRRAGREVLACPCLNAGQLLPPVSRSIANTRLWAHKVRDESMLGLINSSWACFHVPLAPQQMLVAATGRLARDPDADVGPTWQARWLGERFGCDPAGVPRALEALGAPFEVHIPGLPRPFSPLPYGYMNLMLHYRGAHEERRRRGAYPLDWEEIDFADIYNRGVEQVRSAGPADNTSARLDGVLAAYPPARDAVVGLAGRATRRREEARLAAELAELKLLSARVFAHGLRGEGDAAALRGALRARRAPLADALRTAYEPGGVARLMRAWWEPLHRAVGG